MNCARLWIRLGRHGRRHKVSCIYLNLTAYDIKKKVREDVLAEWMHNNGLGS